MFSGCILLENLEKGNNCVISGISHLSGIFNNCFLLPKIDIKFADTSTTTDMSYMFKSCTKLTSIDLSNFETSKVTNMSSMFSNCFVLKSIDVSHFDTSNVEDMNNLFSACSLSLINLIKNINNLKI